MGEIVIKHKIIYQPSIRAIKTTFELTNPPQGSIRKLDQKSRYVYTEIIRYTGYNSDGEKIERWQGVNCGGDINNDVVFHINNSKQSICDICRNQISCIFANKNNQFQMVDDYIEYRRETIADWVCNNFKKYKIKKEEFYKILDI
ncbi:hypothetical protein AAGG74_18490 [Bacillus mexicanus]|uniref:hypothetical protein n=1 Tax=Bacillus mexicanus TaxID=2834415 RepID=UPI003D22F351